MSIVEDMECISRLWVIVFYITDVFFVSLLQTTNTIQQLTQYTSHQNTTEQEKSGIYKLTCNTCKLSYIGQTNCSLQQRYKEHIRYIKYNDPQSAYALHILNNRHQYGTITDKTYHQPNNATPIRTIIYTKLPPPRTPYTGTTHLRRQSRIPNHPWRIRHVTHLQKQKSITWTLQVLPITTPRPDVPGKYANTHNNLQ